MCRDRPTTFGDVRTCTPPGPGEAPRGALFKLCMNIFRSMTRGLSCTNSRASLGIILCVAWGVLDCISVCVASVPGAKHATVRHCRARDTSPNLTLWPCRLRPLLFRIGMRSVLTFIQRWPGFLHLITPSPFVEEVEHLKQLLLGNSLPVATSSEQPQRQKTEELPPTNFTNSILNSDCLRPCLERTSASHNMWAALQDMETALVHILQIDAVQRFPTNIWEIVVFCWEWHQLLFALTLCQRGQHERRFES